ncbi:MAG TPA: sugar transferase, partial [Acidimicrobiales bacterium]|nr:sugar transferase [Acidimicrobiales bacterium]
VDAPVPSTHSRLAAPRRPGLGPGFVRLVADTGALLVAMVAAAVAQALAHHAAGDAPVVLGALGWLAVCLPVFVVVLGGSRHRLASRMQTTVAQQVREIVAPLAASGLVCLGVWRTVAAVADVPKPPEDGLLLTGLLATVLVAVARAGVPARPGARTCRVLLVGSGQVADRVSERLQAHGRVEVVGFVDDDPLDPRGRLGSLADLADVCEAHGVDHVVVAFSRVSAERMVEALRSVQGHLPMSVVPRLFDVLPATADSHDLASGYPALSVGPTALGLWHQWVKRAMDLMGAGLGMVVVLPVMAVTALCVRCTSRGPVFVRQARVGLRGREFTVWKFRTFTVTESVPPPEVLASGEHVAGPFPKLKHDPRTTSLGRVLRRTSLDELPQLLNVLTGSMSLVGPRPMQPEFAWDFGQWALRRYDVKPGLTGLWQVSGRNDLTYEEMCRLDNLYVTCWSPGLDLRVLARTARAVVSGRGCY